MFLTLTSPSASYPSLHLGLQVIEGCSGNANSTGLGQLFKPRRNIDAVTVKIAVVLDEDVAEINADPVLDSLFLVDILFAALSWPAGLRRRIGPPRPPKETATRIPSPVVFNDPAMVLMKGGVDQFPPMAFLTVERANLVGLHQSGIANHVRCEDRC